jgi:hypothetical protein
MAVWIRTHRDDRGAAAHAYAQLTAQEAVDRAAPRVTAWSIDQLRQHNTALTLAAIAVRTERDRQLTSGEASVPEA